MNGVTLDDIHAPRTIAYRTLQRTPLLRHAPLDAETGLTIYVKNENHNPTSAFKVRGGLNLIGRLSPSERRGVITPTTGKRSSRSALGPPGASPDVPHPESPSSTAGPTIRLPGVPSLDDRLQRPGKSGTAVAAFGCVDGSAQQHRAEPACGRQTESRASHRAELVVDQPIVEQLAPGRWQHVLELRASQLPG
jgi:hypothetical protein